MTRRDDVVLICLKLLLISSGVTLAEESSGHASDLVPAHCAAPDKHEPVLSYDDFHWSYTADQMKEKYVEIYSSGKRLTDRARWNEKTKGHELVYTSRYHREMVPITEAFIDSVRSHIERALNLGYARHVFFPDMGHAHLLISQPYYDAVIRHITFKQQHMVYVQALAHPDSRFLYHTAEQLRMLDESNELLPDKYLGWRYYTRNLVGRNNSDGKLDIHRNLESMANTVCQVKSAHRYWSAGFHVSASKDGCFSFRQDDETYRFDISLRDLSGNSDGHGVMVSTEAETPDRLDAGAVDVWGVHGCGQ